jgi:hypothetical protein
MILEKEIIKTSGSSLMEYLQMIEETFKLPLSSCTVMAYFQLSRLQEDLKILM